MGASLDSSFQQRLQLEHSGCRLALATTESGFIYYSVETSAGIWTPPSPFVFSNEPTLDSQLDSVSSEAVIRYLFNAHSPTGVRPFKAVSDGRYLFLFRYSPVGALWMDRFILDQNSYTFVRPFDLRDPSTGSSTPGGQLTRFSSRHRDGTNFFVPTVELSFLGRLEDSDFQVACLRDEVIGATLWTISYVCPVQQSLVITSFRTGIEGTVDINDHASLSLNSILTLENTCEHDPGISRLKFFLTSPESKLSHRLTLLREQEQKQISDVGPSPIDKERAFKLLVSLESGDEGVAILTLSGAINSGLRLPLHPVTLVTLRKGGGATHLATSAELRFKEFDHLEDRTGRVTASLHQEGVLSLPWSGSAFFASEQQVRLESGRAYEVGVEWESDADADLSELLLVGWDSEGTQVITRTALPGALTKLPSGRQLARGYFLASTEQLRYSLSAFQAPAGRWTVLKIHHAWLRPLEGDVTFAETTTSVELTASEASLDANTHAFCPDESSANVYNVSKSEYLVSRSAPKQLLKLCFAMPTTEWKPGGRYRIELRIRCDYAPTSCFLTLKGPGAFGSVELRPSDFPDDSGEWLLVSNQLLMPMLMETEIMFEFSISTRYPCQLLQVTRPRLCLLEASLISPDAWKSLVAWHPSIRSAAASPDHNAVALIHQTFEGVHWHEYLVNEQITVHSGQRWCKSFEFLHEDLPEHVRASFYGADARGQTHHIVEPELLPLSDGWTRARYEFTVPEGMRQMRVFNLFAPSGEWGSFKVRNPRLFRPYLRDNASAEFDTVQLRARSFRLLERSAFDSLSFPVRILNPEWQKRMAEALKHRHGRNAALSLRRWQRIQLPVVELTREAQSRLHGCLMSSAECKGYLSSWIVHESDIFLCFQTQDEQLYTLLFSPDIQAFTFKLEWQQLS